MPLPVKGISAFDLCPINRVGNGIKQQKKSPTKIKGAADRSIGCARD
jgi:hypothetical protein